MLRINSATEESQMVKANIRFFAEFTLSATNVLRMTWDL